MKHTLGSLIIVLLTCSGVWAQGSAQISGNVGDQSGAVLPGVEITATQTATGVTRTTVTNETGSYVLPSLPTGPYRIEAVLPGFRTYVQSGIVLEVNSNPVINVVLQIGQVAETVEVQANAALVETRSVGVGQIMESERILELPLNGRNVTELITLSGAAVQTGVSSPRSMPGQQQISVAGGLRSGVAYSLDGAIHNNPYDNLSLPLPFPDALQEFKVETSALSASEGRHSGAQVNAVTKSGTNEFHGSLFHFIRNDLFNAREYFSPRGSTLKRNQFGGTAGGPIKENKLFFFGGYQGTTVRRDPASRESWVPTPAMLAGDFRAFANCHRLAPLRAPFVDNQVSPSLFSPAALNLARRLPAPQDECGLVRWGGIERDNESQIIGKVDWQASSSHSLIGRVLFTGNSRQPPHTVNPENLLTASNANANGWDNLAQSYTIGDTWLASPTTVLSNRLVVNYTDVQRLGASIFNATELGVRNFYSYITDYSQIGLGAPGFAIGGGTQSFSTFRTFSSGLNSDASLVRGAHQWSLGGAFLWIDSNSNANVQSPGTFSFNGRHTGTSMADFLLGRLNNVVQSAPNTDYMRKWYVGLYMADIWKVSTRLTMNYGLRWEPDLAETLTLGRVATFSHDRRQQGIRSTQFVNAPPGFYYPGDPGFQGKRGRDRNWSTLAPRFGFAYDVFGDGRTSVRASTGIAYDSPNAQYHLWTSIIPPFGGNTTNPNNPIFDDPWATFPGGNPFPLDLGATARFVPFGAFTTMSNIKPAQHQTWNLALQQQLGNNWLVSASYIGSHTIQMLESNALNPAVYFPGNANAAGQCTGTGYWGETFTLRGLAPNAVCSTTANVNQRRMLSLVDFANTGQFVSQIAEIASGPTANYNGMLLEVRKRASQGVTLNGNYTWSHCIGPYADDEAGQTGANPALANVFINRRAYGNCTADRRHLLNMTAVLEMPRFASHTLDVLASGWRLSTIYRFQTGSYLTITSGGGANTDLARTGENTGSQVANYVGGDPLRDRSMRPNTFWLNRAAFAPEALGTFGNVGIRSIQGPSTWDWDMALSRIFRVKEAHRLEVRAEMYNVPNSFRPGNPSTNLDSPFFGELRTSRAPRIMQFALKYLF